MLNKLLAMIRRYEMVAAGDTVVCAVSGGADSMALLFGLYLLRQKLQIRLEAAHFNHGLRGEESDRDEAFVRRFCDRYDIPLHTASAAVRAGEKGLEAAAREARYAFFDTLPGLIATAHTANDNAETVLMHLVRGTGLKGLGGITPKRQRLIRPMLLVTREQVLAFLEEYHVSYVEDSTNAADAFLRNRLRHHVMPLLEQENPSLAENLSAMALRLRLDEQALSQPAFREREISVSWLLEQSPARRSRVIAQFLENCGVREPEAEHIGLVEALACSEKPSARVSLPGGITLCRSYDVLRTEEENRVLPIRQLSCGGKDLPEAELRVICEEAPGSEANTPEAFTVYPVGNVVVRHRLPGDEMRLSGGRKTLKKLFIDRKIPVRQRLCIPVIADEQGVLGVWGIGANLDRTADGPKALRIRFEKREKSTGGSL